MSKAESFEAAGYSGELDPRYRPVDLERELERLVDPSCSRETLHWSRSFLYTLEIRTEAGPLAVAVKQFDNSGWRARFRRRSRGGKARSSWRAARRLDAAGIATADPVMLIESASPTGPSFFVTRRLEGFTESRYLFRALSAGRLEEEFAGVDRRELFGAMGRYLRRVHDAGLRHRDLSIGNLLVSGLGEGRPPTFHLIDLNRARLDQRLGTHARTRDLCRLPVLEPAARAAFLQAYWGTERYPRARGLLFTLYARLFLARNWLKRWLRKPLAPLKALLPRGTHAHIPPPPPGVTSRDKAVWDHLSDQPHQHAGRLERGRVRLQDTAVHGRAAAAATRAAPRVWRRYRQLRAGLYSEPVPWRGVGVAVQPSPASPEQLVEALDELGVRRVLVRVQPWLEDLSAEERLAARLSEAGYDLTFALPQSRELVAEPRLWREAVERIAAGFLPFGSRFQVGQAINRSKWGVWNYEEYLRLATEAREILRAAGEVTVLGPAVIDFEFHATLAVLNMEHPGFYLDAVSSLLYVDRRGAPENRQLGFDTVAKVVLLKAIAETSRFSGDECWITEVNWPLWEGPHSPAGKKVSVDEETQADYLARFYLLALTTGLVEGVFWWRLAARGYGLLDPSGGDKLRRRPAFAALANLRRQLEGSTFLRPLEAPPGAHLLLFETPDAGELAVGWSAAETVSAELPAAPVERIDRDGVALAGGDSRRVELGGAPCYFRLP